MRQIRCYVSSMSLASRMRRTRRTFLVRDSETRRRRRALTGIGTGWATSVPNFNPLEIIDNLRRYLRAEKLTDMQPWYRGFIGDIQTQDRVLQFVFAVPDSFFGSTVRPPTLIISRKARAPRAFRAVLLPECHTQVQGNFDSVGILRKLSPTQIEIQELPIKSWTSAYKEFLDDMLPSIEVQRRRRTRIPV